MGVYRRKESSVWWISWTDAAGRRQRKSAETQDRTEARKLLDACRRLVRAQKKFQADTIKAGTVSAYAAGWVAERKERGLSTAGQEEQRFRDHINPRFGQVLLRELEVPHVRDWVRDLQKAGQYAPRTIRHLVGLLHNMYEQAIEDKAAISNPCKLKRGVLPKKRDKDPTWRALAEYTRHEAELLISTEEIPPHRRVRYALLFLTGARIGEVLWWRWRNYHREAVPLGMLLAAGSWSTKLFREKGTKTEVPRKVPVHPTLAAILADWRLGGWAAFMGRPPTEDDLICPAGPRTTLSRRHDKAGEHLNSNRGLEQLQADLERLGLRKRDQHSTRRTFLTLGQADGASKDLLLRVSHGVPDDIVGKYSSNIPFDALCREVAKLQISRLEGRVTRLQTGSGPGGPDGSGGGGVTVVSQAAVTTENHNGNMVGGEGLENYPKRLGGRSGRTSTSRNTGSAVRLAPGGPDGQGDCDHCDDPSGYIRLAAALGLRVLDEGDE